MNIGLDPDLYPLFASSQALSGGSNVTGIQDPTLNRLLVAARVPGTQTRARGRLFGARERLATGRYLLPLFFEDDLVVARRHAQGPAIRQLCRSQ